MKKAAIRFKTFIIKLKANQEFEPEEIDTSFDNKETPEAIKANLIDKIEDAKGVDLTSKAAIVKDAQVKRNEEISKGMKKNDPMPWSDVTATNTTDQKSLPTEEIEKDTTNLTKTADKDKLRNRESDLEKIASTIDQLANDSKDTDEALDKIDQYNDIKNLIIDLDSMKDDTIKIDASRAARLNELDKKFLDTSVKGRSIRDILDNSSEKAETLEVTKLEIASPNED